MDLINFSTWNNGTNNIKYSWSMFFIIKICFYNLDENERLKINRICSNGIINSNSILLE